MPLCGAGRVAPAAVCGKTASVIVLEHTWAAMESCSTLCRPGGARNSCMVAPPGPPALGGGSGIATDSNELHDLFKRQCSLFVSVRSMCTLQTMIQPCATRSIYVLTPYNGHKNCMHYMHTIPYPKTYVYRYRVKLLAMQDEDNAIPPTSS